MDFNDQIYNNYYRGWGRTEAESDWKATGGSKAGSSGGGYSGGRYVGEVDLSSIPSVQDYIKGQFATEDPYLQVLLSRMAGQEKPLDIYSRLETEAGLPELRATSKTLSGEIANIEDYLDMIEPNVSARTRESLVTEAQRQGMVGAEKKPWIEKLGKLGTSLGRIQTGISEATQGIGTKTQLAMTGQQMELEPLKLAYSTMVDRNSRLTTGFTTDRQTQLDVLFDKLNRTRQLSDQEWQLANELASEERSYMRTLQTTASQAGYKVTGSESADDLLSIIGTTAAEAIQWERAYKTRAAGRTGTAEERSASKALVALRNDVAQGVTFENLVRTYSSVLPVYQIQAEYNSGSRYGPAKESAATIGGWTVPATTQYTTEAKAKESEGKIRITRPDGSVVEF